MKTIRIDSAWLIVNGFDSKYDLISVFAAALQVVDLTARDEEDIKRQFTR